MISKRRKRSDKGSFLVEAIVAVLVASLIAAALAQMYTSIRRASNMTQGELYAINVAQACIDQVRIHQYNILNENMGTSFPVVNGTGNPANILFPRPLMKDSAYNYTGSFTTGSGSSAVTSHNSTDVLKQSEYTFHTLNPDTGQRDDTVKVELTAGPIANSIMVQVTIDYLDTSGAVKRYQTSSLVTQLGLHS